MVTFFLERPYPSCHLGGPSSIAGNEQLKESYIRIAHSSRIHLRTYSHLEQVGIYHPPTQGHTHDSDRRITGHILWRYRFCRITFHPEAAIFEYSSKGFWWPQPSDNPPKEWAMRSEDLRNEQCTFLLKKCL